MYSFHNCGLPEQFDNYFLSVGQHFQNLYWYQKLGL